MVTNFQSESNNKVKINFGGGEFYRKNKQKI